MIRTHRRFAVALLLASFWASEPAHADVRTESPKFAALMHDAATRSETFRALMAAIDATDGIVYVTPG